jgi:sterol desaturase/sphingolipid hydroxylase (fatty acid hydroxylase superfamily)
VILQIILGILYANTIESLIHKHILHGLGKNKDSFWAFHYHDHHKRTTKGGGIDATYKDNHFYGRELWALAFLALAHAPLFWVATYFACTIFVYLILYYYVHVKSHMNTRWAKKWIPWHYDHHMSGKAANWGVLLPLYDILTGSRVCYVGTSKYYRDERKRRD